MKVLLVAQSVKALQAEEEAEDQIERAAVSVAHAELTHDLSSGASVQKAAGVGVAVAQWDEMQENWCWFVSVVLWLVIVRASWY